MNNKEALWFVGKCLSLSVHPEKAKIIQEIIQSEQVDWQSVVYQSSNQLILPAFYLNLKRNHLLPYLPDDLMAHLDEITNLNRERNQNILKQISEITRVLRENSLEPVFIKGSAHLLDGLYKDIAERMLSDIDFLLEEKDAKKAFHLLSKEGYERMDNYEPLDFGEGRHFPSLIKIGENARIEIHRRLLEGKYDKIFNWSTLQTNFQKSKSSLKALILSDTDLILNNMMNVQMNDKAKRMHKTLLRQSYDLMLLSKRQNPLEISKAFGRFFDHLNSYIALSADLLDYPKLLNFEDNKSINRYVWRIHFIWEHPRLSRIGAIVYFILFRIYRYVSSLILFFINSSTRRRVIKSLKDPTYFGKHFEQYKVWFS